MPVKQFGPTNTKDSELQRSSSGDAISSICDILTQNRNASTNAHIRAVHLIKKDKTLLRALDNRQFITMHLNTNCAVLLHKYGHTCRILYCIADTLLAMSDGHDGASTESIEGKDWKSAIQLISSGDDMNGFESFAQIRDEWCNSPVKCVQAAHYYEAVVQSFIRQQVLDICEHKITKVREAVFEPSTVTVCGCARVDFAGAWSDTPPITFEHGTPTAVLNAALNGKRPIGARCRPASAEENGISIVVRQSAEVENAVVLEKYKFENVHDIGVYCTPKAPGALFCAVLVAADVITIEEIKCDGGLLLSTLVFDKFSIHGLVLESWSDVPKGSGLGTSSILAGCMYTAIITCLTGVQPSNNQVIHAVLYIEQLLTTGGGWQDQVGGCMGGLKIGRFTKSAGISVDKLELSLEVLRIINEQFVLVYTGQTRLAKNVLQKVIRRWYLRENNVINTVTNIVKTTEDCAVAFQNMTASNAQETLHKVSLYTKTYNEQKQAMAVNSVPIYVKQLFDQLEQQKLILSGWMNGAGGGGFCCLLLNDSHTSDDIRLFINNAESMEIRNMVVYEMTIELEDLLVITEKKH